MRSPSSAPRDRVLQEVDIVYNELMDWRTDGSYDPTCSSSVTNPDGTPRLNVALDTQAIATHELGHSLAFTVVLSHQERLCLAGERLG